MARSAHGIVTVTPSHPKAPAGGTCMVNGNGEAGSRGRGHQLEPKSPRRPLLPSQQCCLKPSCESLSRHMLTTKPGSRSPRAGPHPGVVRSSRNEGRTLSWGAGREGRPLGARRLPWRQRNGQESDKIQHEQRKTQAWLSWRAALKGTEEGRETT